jgi:hypothetical protein
MLGNDCLANPARFLDLILLLQQMNLRKQRDWSGERLRLASRQPLVGR